MEQHEKWLSGKKHFAMEPYKDGYVLAAKAFDPDQDAEHLMWLHTIVSNAKAFIDGTFHGLGKKHLQRNLDEFCYRFKRRH